MKRLSSFVTFSLIVVSSYAVIHAFLWQMSRTVTVRTSSGHVIEVPVDDVSFKTGQEVSLVTVNDNLYRILPTREATGVKVIDSTDLYVIQGVVMQAN